jgi:molecular chaperone GrpE
VEPDATGLVPREEMEEWRDRAQRLQADMENYRRRQRRLAQDEIQMERQRLLRGYLGVIDDLDRALSVTEGGDARLRQGIELTRRGALQFLQREGVEKVEAQDQAFDPAWHEAVATVGRNGMTRNRDTVVQVVESGYRLGDQLLRPARVVVAV